METKEEVSRLILLREGFTKQLMKVKKNFLSIDKHELIYINTSVVSSKLRLTLTRRSLKSKSVAKLKFNLFKKMRMLIMVQNHSTKRVKVRLMEGCLGVTSLTLISSSF